MTSGRRIGVVVIGRNEGARLVASLESVRAVHDGPLVYVDSGSTDGSIEAARAAGARIVNLDLATPFTAARARNAGVAALGGEAPEFLQFIDGDCMLDPAWLGRATTFLDDRPDVAAVCGRRRERFPGASLYNRLADREWDTPVGAAQSCGGDVLVRKAAFDAVGGYDASLIAGEEPEMCLRMRERGWVIWRLDAEMTLHDAAMTSLGQYWRRAKRAGHAYAEVSAMHSASPARIWATETRRALTWSALGPAALALGLAAHPAFFAVLLVYPAQVLRMARRERASLGPDALAAGALNTLSKFAEASGVVEYWSRRLRGARSELIEYK